MRKGVLYTTVLSLFFWLNAKAQAPDWAFKVGGTLTDQINSVAVDGSGNVYVTGSFESSGVDFDPGSGTTALSCAGGTDIFLAKYSSAGALLWAKQIGGNSNDAGAAICIDVNDNIWITGHFTGTVDFDPSASTTNLAGSGSLNAFVAKFSPAGAFMLARPISGSGSDAMGSGICVNRNNARICIVGRCNGAVDLDPSASNYNLTSSGLFDVMFAEYSLAGALIAGKNFGGTGNDVGMGIGTDASGNYYLTGRFSGTADFDPSASTNSKTANGTADAFVAKYNSSFAPQWISAFGGAADQDFGICLGVDGSGDVVAGGYLKGTADMDPSAGTVNLSSASGNVISGYVVKYTTAGAHAWSFPVASPTYTSTVWGLTMSVSGDVYITGYAGSFDADPTAAVYTVDCFQHDAYVAYYSAAGLLNWAIPVRGNSVGNGYSVGTHTSGNVFLGGSFADSVDINPGPNIKPMVSTGQSFDALLQKFVPCNIPLAPAVVNDTVCAGTNVVLTAPGSNIGWYNAATGNSYYGANNKVIPNIQSTITLWAQDSTCMGGKRTQKKIVVKATPTVDAFASAAAVCEGETANLWATGGSTYTWSTFETTDTIQPVPTGPSQIFYVIGTNSVGCSDTTSVSVTVNALPVASISPANAAVCAGTEVVLTAANYVPANTYAWSNSGSTEQVTVTPTISTTYSLIVTAPNGCVSYDTADVVTDTVNLNVAQTGFLLTSAEVNADTYQWIDCNTGAEIDGETDATYTANANGSYAIVVTRGGCTDTSACKTVTGVGINEVTGSIISVTPNPFTDYLNIQLQNTTRTESALYNIDGRLVKKLALQPGNNKVNVSELPRGVYVIKTASDGAAIERRLIK